MSIDNGITVIKIPFILIIHEYGTCKIIVFFISMMQVSLIILSMDNRIINIRHSFHINPSHHIIINTFQRFKVNVHRSLQSPFCSGFRRFLRVTLCHCHLCYMIVLICSLFVLCINMKQIIAGIAKNTNCCDQNHCENHISCCFLFFRFLL